MLAELGGLYLALWQAPEGAQLTIVHDYKGVADWMEGRWKAQDPIVTAVSARRCGVKAAPVPLRSSSSPSPSAVLLTLGADKLILDPRQDRQLVAIAGRDTSVARCSKQGQASGAQTHPSSTLCECSGPHTPHSHPHSPAAFASSLASKRMSMPARMSSPS